MPAYSNGITACPSNATSQRMRAGESHVGGIPAHGLFKLDPGDQPGQRLSEHFAGGAAGLFDDGHHVTPALQLADLQILRGQTFALGKANGGGGGCADPVEGALSGRAFDQVLPVGLARGE